jgi:integrase
MQFDARAAKALQPGQYIVVDGCDGLRLCASASCKTWTYRYKSPLSGLMKQMRIGHWPEVALAEAVSQWSALRARRAAGEDPGLARRQAAAASVARQAVRPYTLGDMVRDYVAGHLATHRQAKGARAVQLRLERAIAGHEGMPVADASRRFVFDLITGLADTPMLAKSVKSEMGAAWAYAQDAGKMPEDLPNWWRQVLARKLRSKGAMRAGERKGTGKRVLQPVEVRALVLHDLGLFSQQVQDFLILQLWTCARGCEICIMRREHLREDAAGVLWWTMPKAMTKNRHIEDATDLRVPLLGRAEQVVRRLLGPGGAADVGGGWLFASRSRAGVLQGQTQAYMQSKVHYLQPYSQTKPHHVRQRLRVTHWSPHDLRRTGRTMLAALGCPHEVGEAILGHVVPGVAGDYNLYRYDKERVRWLRKLAAELERTVANTALPDLPPGPRQ